MRKNSLEQRGKKPRVEQICNNQDYEKEQPSRGGTGTKFLISKFLITKFIITKFIITKFLSNKVPNALNS
jgi:hypothetical protein